jgi:transposase-like protein
VELRDVEEMVDERGERMLRAACHRWVIRKAIHSNIWGLKVRRKQK